MASNSSLKGIWTQYNLFKNWTASNPQKFHILNDSFEDEDLIPKEKQNESASFSTTPCPVAVIVGVVYPTAEIFEKRGLKLRIEIPAAYPGDPPAIIFETTVLHPNISSTKKVLCISILDKLKKYKMSLQLSDIINEVIECLNKPEMDAPVDAETATLYQNNKEAYDQQTRDSAQKNGIPRK